MPSCVKNVSTGLTTRGSTHSASLRASGARNGRSSAGRPEGRLVRRLRRIALLLLAAAVAVAVAHALWPRPRTIPQSIDHWARAYGIDPHLARAVAWMESGYRADARSPTGARGVMQVEPGTWRYTEGLLGERVPPTTDGNVRIGIAYLHHLLLEFRGDRRLALAAYYEGPQALRERGVYPSAERYVANVLALSRRL